MDNKILFTVFTPIYNRKDLLPREYNSLQKQTYRDFEWVIIDAGLTDGTSDLVKQWQPNQGKHFAYNAVAKIAQGELFTSINSDDEVVPLITGLCFGKRVKYKLFK